MNPDSFVRAAFTDEYAADFSRQLEAAKKFSLQCIELRGADGVNVSAMSTSQVKDYSTRLRDAGVGVSAIGSPLGKIPLDGDLKGHMETAKKIFEFAGILDTKYIRIFSFYGTASAPIHSCKNQVVELLGRMLDLADSFGLCLCHENEAAIYGDSPSRCLELMEEFGGRLGCVFDMGNFVLEQADPWKAYLMLEPYIRYFHIKDALSAGAVVPPGKGEAQIHRILSAHSSRHEGTVISLEPHLQTFDGLNALVGGSGFSNPYQYPDCETAFADAVNKLEELMRV